MAADLHPTSSSGVQVDGNGQMQPVRGRRGRPWLFLHGSPAEHAPDSRHPPRARLPDTRAGEVGRGGDSGRGHARAETSAAEDRAADLGEGGEGGQGGVVVVVGGVGWGGGVR